ncbi:hypothetical protein CR513_04902, partial [Mucuna pruriens]
MKDWWGELNLKVHEIVLKGDEELKKRKSIALKVRTYPKGSSSKAFKAEKSFDEALSQNWL